ncbi:H-2 class II histocompatibility antigen, I-E beta chain [Collichthys lucidus]|uniref:H-2 class II histocompatibility antigen, I-E beta chain n=1 Tax=Collichthys lucidus TaxID=240159 RepID=A0A4U5V2K7_COLLU|nr:H-2 class II histocompatibility antigen, I-E beta chain [Collichthys lucidus]
MYSLDGEEVWYADFTRGKGVDPQPSFTDHMIYQEGTYEQAVAHQAICRESLKIAREGIKDPLEFDPPSSPMIYTRDDVELGQKNVLLCHVTGFYPAPVTVYWTKNGGNVTEGTSINVPFPNKDGSYRQTSRLEFTPQLGDVYSCTVKHLSLQQPLTRIWDGFRISVLDICDFNSTDLKNIEFIRSWYYNKVEFARFSSSLGEFVGFTEFGLKQAKYWNSDASYMAQLRGDKERYCQHNIQIWYNQILDKSAEPYVRLHSATPPGGHHPSMLVCSVFDFYPQHIKVSWLRDGQEVTSDVTSTDELADADWSGEKISCVVEHASLKEPLITDWGRILVPSN